MKRKVIVGAAGSGTGFSAITSLRKNWGGDVHIVAIDVNPRHLVTAALIADTFVQAPPAASASFGDFLASQTSDGGWHFMPLLPDELMSASQSLVASSCNNSYKLIGAEPSGALSLIDKLHLFENLRSGGIASPRTQIATPDMIVRSKSVIKPRRGFGSKGVYHVEANGEFPLLNSFGDYIVQEHITGPEFTVDAFCDQKAGHVWTVCRERIEVKSGVSVKCRIIRDSEFDTLALKLAGLFGIRGTFCFQVIVGTAGPMLIDLNPRPGAGTSMSILTGNDFFAAAFSLAFAEDYRKHFSTISGECYITRQYVDFLS